METGVDMVEENKRTPNPLVEDWKRNLETSRKLREDKEPQSLVRPETDEVRSNFLNTESLQIIGNYRRTIDVDDAAKINTRKMNQLYKSIEKFAKSNKPFPYEDYENLFTEEVIDEVIKVEILNMGDILFEIDKIIEKSEIISGEYIPEEDNPLYGQQTMTEEVLYEPSRYGIPPYRTPELVQSPTSQSQPVKDEMITARIFPRQDLSTRKTFRVNAKETLSNNREVSLTRANLSNDNILTSAYKQMAKSFALDFFRKDNLMASVMKTMYNRMAQLKAKKRNLITGPEFIQTFNKILNDRVLPFLEYEYESNTYEGVIGEITRNNKTYFNRLLNPDSSKYFPGLAYLVIYDNYDITEENNQIIKTKLNERYELGDQVKSLRGILLDILTEYKLGTLSKLNGMAREVKEKLDSGNLKLSMEFLKADISSLDEDRRREIKTILQNSHPTEYFGEDYLKLGKLINILGDVADTSEEQLLEELGVENLQMVKKAAALRKIYERLYRTIRDIVYEEE